MIRLEDRDMKSGTMDRRKSRYDGIIGFISERKRNLMTELTTVVQTTVVLGTIKSRYNSASTNPFTYTKDGRGKYRV